jgi:CheY-like chemotaxis protein
MKKIVFLVDDDEEDIMMIKEAFVVNGLDYDLYAFESGQKLIDYLNSPLSFGISPVYIIIDINMPGMNGIETIRSLRETVGFHSTPIIGFSFSKNKNDIKQAFEAGVSHYVKKPVLFRELISRIEGIDSWVENYQPADC